MLTDNTRIYTQGCCQKIQLLSNSYQKPHHSSNSSNGHNDIHGCSESWTTCNSLVLMGTQLPLEQLRPARATLREASTAALCKIISSCILVTSPWSTLRAPGMSHCGFACGNAVQGNIYATEKFLTAYPRVRKSWTSP